MIATSELECIIFLWWSRDNHSITQGGVEGSFRLLLTKNPAYAFSSPSSQVPGISFERFLRPWQFFNLH